jgi:hypothetical protein
LPRYDNIFVVLNATKKLTLPFSAGCCLFVWTTGNPVRDMHYVFFQ